MATYENTQVTIDNYSPAGGSRSMRLEDLSKVFNDITLLASLPPQQSLKGMGNTVARLIEIDLRHTKLNDALYRVSDLDEHGERVSSDYNQEQIRVLQQYAASK